MSESERSPLARLVLFMVIIAAAGTFIAGTHYVLIDGPQQYYATHPPQNTILFSTMGDSCDSGWEKFLAWLHGYCFLDAHGDGNDRICNWDYC